MAALVLSTAGGALGSVFGPAGAIAGRIAGALAGNLVDRALFGGGNTTTSGPRLSDLDIMASTEGAPIPRVYGRARLAGQVIWATRLEEVATDETSSGGKGGTLSGPSNTTTTYSYFTNFAVGLCEGTIGRIGRIWADGKLLDTTPLNIRVHRGDDNQTADDLIVAKEGAASAPAYRGLAYVVFERLPLAGFGNRIPQLSFEIIRPVGDLERMARAVTLIPGTTEFGYEPATVVAMKGPGQSAAENRHVTHARSDVVAALDDLQSLCPNLERIALVVAWFGSDLRAGYCTIKPGVDSAIKVTSKFPWSVNGVTRNTAMLVSQVNGAPAFGGTPSDQSVVHLINEVKARGLKITFYPFVMMDIPADNLLPDPWTGSASQPAYPWRGRITCDPAPGRPGSPDGTSLAATQVANFFTGGVWNYRRMILHYAALAASAGGVDAFLIGSELKALTRVRSSPGVYPAVSALVRLAADVKAIVGPATLVTYAADWTEYGSHVVDAAASEVRFPLDPLWASPDIGAVGIDYYAPLADWRDTAGHLDQAGAQSGYERAYLARNIRSGESYDWYYANDTARAAQARTPITDGLNKRWTFRAKDLWGWWSNPHRERSGGIEAASPTGWVPQSKPIWFTEVGCPAVDKGANQPSVFPDPKSSENFLPYFSTGARDDLIQRRALEAVLATFDPAYGATPANNPVSAVYGGRMIDVSAIHLWTWDARPYPVFPAASDVWTDAGNWQTGHWLNGRLGGAPLDALMATLLADSGISGVATDALTDICDGYVVDRPMSPRAMIEPLSMAYAFDATTSGGQLAFVPRGGKVVAEIGEADLVQTDNAASSRLTRGQETELPREVSFGFTDGLADYRRSAVMSRRLVGGANRTVHSDFALVTNDAAATRRAEIWLQDLWAGRETIQFGLGPEHLALEPGDVIGVTLKTRRRLFEIDDIVDTTSRQIKARSIDPEVFNMPMGRPRVLPPSVPQALGPLLVKVLDLPVQDAASPVVLTRLAILGRPWPGAAVVWMSSDGASYKPFATLPASSTIGETLDALPAGPTSRWDRANSFRVRLYGGALTSQSDLNVLSGRNLAAIETSPGVWEVIQFANAQMIDGVTFKLSRLLRGLGGSEAAMLASVPAGATVVMLDQHLVAVASGLDALERPLNLRIAASGLSHDDASAVALTLTPGRTALRPLSPAHLRGVRRSDGVHLSWIRRTRSDGDSWAGEVPLGEEIEAYALDILNGSTLVRSIACTTPSALYAIADEIADFGIMQAKLTVRVAQISSTIGAGTPAQRNLTP